MVAGTVHPTYIKVYPFKANIFELRQERVLQICDIFRLVICIYVAFCIIKNRHSYTSLFGILSVATDFLIIFFFFFSWVLSYYYSKYKSIELINSKDYIDYISRAHWYQ